MNLEQAKKLWNLHPDEETDIELKESDRFFQIGGYFFVIAAGGNVVLRKIKESKFTIFDAFRALRFYCIKYGIQFLRVEGNLRRYKFLPKMFPQLEFRQDTAITNRRVLYVRVF